MDVTPSVEEYQGLYGPYQVSELVLQKIWLKGAYDASRLMDCLGRPIQVLSPGKWNRLAGPDFQNANLLIGGEEIEGDVEIHFSQYDWERHRHHRNPNFDKVVLHVVYHPLRENGKETLSYSGKRIPTAALLDLLWYDLEEYASDDSLIGSTGSANEGEIDGLLDLSMEERWDTLMSMSVERWNLKRDFAKLRIDRLGFIEACHQTALEIMGYSANRIPMLHVAGNHSLESFKLRIPGIDELWAAGSEYWTTSGVRPANHPKIRLEQYINWISVHINWHDVLLGLADSLPKGPLGSGTTAEYRKTEGVAGLQIQFFENVVGRSVSGPKLDTLICDGFLPLLSAETEADFGALWFHWFAGNAPRKLGTDLRKLGVLDPRRFPLSNGWIQGLLKAGQLSA